MERPAQIIEELRIRNGLTQAGACSRGGVPRATWSMVESGCTEHPRPATKLRIARALDVAPGRIWPVRPVALHLHDVEDPRWAGAVRSMARRLELGGSRQEREQFGDRLVSVLDQVDGDEADGGRWQEFWEIAGSLLLGRRSDPIAIVDGKLLEPDLGRFARAPRISRIRSRRRSNDGVA
jgi:transcriptional regulator with XRE-family HTH domain